jgi:putative spermidine/putrescine transport system permease protein
MKATRAWWWLVFLVGFLYFFLPLLGTFLFSLGNPTGPVGAPPSLEFYANVLTGPGTGFWSSLIYSFVIGIITIIVSVGLLLPTAFWVRLRVPRARPVVEFITLLPFVIPPIVLVFGLISTFSHPPLPFTYTDIGSSALLTFAYVVLSFPYMYRAIDTGLQAIDIRSLTEAAQSLGAGWPRIIVGVILPNVRVALLSGAFLTLAIVVGEYTIATFLARPAFGVYLSGLGQTRAYEPAAASIISFGLTWMAMILIAFIGRGSRTRVAVTGAR